MANLVDLVRDLEQGRAAPVVQVERAPAVNLAPPKLSKREREAQTRQEKAQAFLGQCGLGNVWDVFKQATLVCCGKTLPREESVVVDIVGKLIKYGSISEAQCGYLRKLLYQIEHRAEIQAKREAEQAAALPVPEIEDRVLFKGKVLSIKDTRNTYGDYPAVKALVQHVDGWKLWGNLPSNLWDKVSRDSEVEFMATIKRSDKDPKFGFWSRPTNGRVVNPALRLV